MNILWVSILGGGVLFALGKLSIQDYSMEASSCLLLILAQISLFLVQLSIAYLSLDKLTSYEYLVLFSLLISASVSDIRDQTVKDFLILGASLLMILILILLKGPILKSLLGGLLAFLSLYLIYSLSQGKLGGADVKIFFPIGLAFGLRGALNSLVLASYWALIYILLLFLLNVNIREKKISFVPFLFMGSLLGLYINLF